MVTQRTDKRYHCRRKSLIRQKLPAEKKRSAYGQERMRPGRKTNLRLLEYGKEKMINGFFFVCFSMQDRILGRILSRMSTITNYKCKTSFQISEIYHSKRYLRRSLLSFSRTRQNSFIFISLLQWTRPRYYNAHKNTLSSLENVLNRATPRQRN